MYKPLETAIISLLTNYRFYGELCLQMNKVFTDKVPIAGVSVTDKINLYINPATFNQMSLEVRVGVLLHEIAHLTEDHIGRSKKLAKTFNKALNVAADRVINERIHVVTKGNSVKAVIPDKLKLIIDGKETEIKPVTKKNFSDMYPNKTVLDGETMEYYYKFLKDNAKKSDGGENDFDGDMDTIDDHSIWDESTNSEEVRKEVLRQAMNKAKDGAGAGNVPGDMAILIEELNKSVVSWRSVLQRFVAKQVEVNIDSSRKRRSRRYGLIHPGTIKDPTLRLGIAVDTSGSVSDAYLTQFMSEVKKISELGIDIFFVQADMRVTAAEEYNPRKKIEIKGRGGTLFQPAIDELMKKKVDGIIYFTDGETFGEELKITVPILWCLCPSYTLPNGQKEKDTVKIPEIK